MKILTKWTTEDFSKAMLNAIYQNADKRFTRKENDTLKFNGFWRNGDKQNVCAWISTASWHDAKTGEGGNCKEFASIAFNMSLPEFMEKFSEKSITLSMPIINKNFSKISKKIDYKEIHTTWIKLERKEILKEDNASGWLINQRGFKTPRLTIKTGFCNLEEDDLKFFDSRHLLLIKNRLKLGNNIIAPIRGIASDQVKNMFFRSINNYTAKEEKSRILNDCGGWSDPDGSPRAFGFPHLITSFPNIILCEGMSDYFAAEELIDNKKDYLPIGVGSASFLPKWALWLTKIKYKGHVTIIYHLDKSKNNEVSVKEVGPLKAIAAARILKENGLDIQIFPWVNYLKNTTSRPQKIKDLADSLQQELTNKECGFAHLIEIFNLLIQKRE